jgi:hypothetical protein
MGFREEIKPYFDPNGLVSGSAYPKSTEGNAILKTAQYVCLLKEQGLFSAQDRSEIITNVLRECEVMPGLFRRSRTMAQDQEGRDDYIALAYLAHALPYPLLAEQILEFGERHRYEWGPIKLYYAYDNPSWDRAYSPVSRWSADTMLVTRNRDAWLGRHRELICSLKWAAKREPTWWEEVLFEIGLEHAGSGSDQDGWMLGRLMAEIAVARGNLKSARIFAARLAAIGGLNAVFQAYLEDKQHPFTRWWKDYRVQEAAK